MSIKGSWKQRISNAIQLNAKNEGKSLLGYYLTVSGRVHAQSIKATSEESSAIWEKHFILVNWDGEQRIRNPAELLHMKVVGWVGIEYLVYWTRASVVVIFYSRKSSKELEKILLKIKHPRKWKGSIMWHISFGVLCSCVSAVSHSLQPSDTLYIEQVSFSSASRSNHTISSFIIRYLLANFSLIICCPPTLDKRQSFWYLNFYKFKYIKTSLYKIFMNEINSKKNYFYGRYPQLMTSYR